MDQWYLAQIKPNQHQLADRNLRRQGFKTFLPLQKVTQRKVSRFGTDLRPLFPGYIFVRVKNETSPWREINSTLGISRLVSYNNKPQKVPLKLISSLMGRCDDKGTLLTPINISIGDTVEVLTGPFADFAATVEKIDAQQRIWILMEFMGQGTKLQIATDKVQLVI